MCIRDRSSGTTSPVITNSIFYHNTATQNGGAVKNDGIDGTTTPTIVNTTFYGNTATDGGAIENEGSGAIPTIFNTILWNNSGDEILNNTGATATLNHSIIDDGNPDNNVTLPSGTTGDNNLDLDPVLSNADGDDEIGGTADDDYHVQGCSPALNSGTATGAPSTDFEGDPRPTGSGHDIGFDESLILCELTVTKKMIGVPTPATTGIPGNYDAVFQYTICNLSLIHI